jgi:hypothetical protein
VRSLYLYHVGPSGNLDDQARKSLLTSLYKGRNLRITPCILITCSIHIPLF